jgi:hypothetical protein
MNDRQKGKQTDRWTQTDGQTDGWMDGQSQTGRESDRWTDTPKYNIYTYTHTDRQSQPDIVI